MRLRVSNLELRHGGTYRSRDGRVFKVESLGEYRGLSGTTYKHIDGGYTWHSDGIFGTMTPYHLDLVEEVPTTVDGNIIEVGKKYLTRSGAVAKVTSISEDKHDNWPVKYYISSELDDFSCNIRGYYSAQNTKTSTNHKDEYDLIKLYGEDKMSYPRSHELEEAKDIIMKGFHWGPSPMGADYWAKVYDNLREMIDLRDNSKVKVLGKEVTLSKEAKDALDKVLNEVPELKEQLISDRD